MQKIDLTSLKLYLDHQNVEFIIIILDNLVAVIQQQHIIVDQNISLLNFP